MFFGLFIYYLFHCYLKGKEYGDVSSRVEIRKRLNCHSFKWFLDNVYPEKFILDENVYAFGEVKEAKFYFECFSKIFFCLGSKLFNVDLFGHAG